MTKEELLQKLGAISVVLRDSDAKAREDAYAEAAQTLAEFVGDDQIVAALDAISQY